MQLVVRLNNFFTKTLLVTSVLTTLAACSGDGSGGGITPPLLRQWEPGIYFSSGNFSNLCENPRSGNDPVFGGPVRDRQGRTVDENNWLRSIHSEFYLWYDEIDDVDPSQFSTPEYFDLQQTFEFSDTGSGRLKDEFHFSLDAQTFVDTLVAGVDAGYGARFTVLAPTVPREVVVALVEPNSPAADAGLVRGDRILVVDGADVVNGSDPATINEGLFPETLDETHQFTIRHIDNSEESIELISEEITSTPVQSVNVINTVSGNVGYILFNDHIATSEAQLIDAIETLIAGNVTDLVLDLRYNGGGFLAIASELAYMIAGEAPTEDKIFERLRFNDQYNGLNVNPLTGGSLTTPFYSTVQGFSSGLEEGDPLPTLNAQNVYIITSENTCSASEAIINGLRGAEVNVFQIGTTTCGKPYGNSPLGNCGTMYLFTQFEGVNELDQGGYSDGFKPENAGGFGVSIPGCEVADDFENALGDQAEANLAAALDYRAGFGCPAAPSMSAVSSKINKQNNKFGENDGAINTGNTKGSSLLKMKIIMP